MWKESLNNEWRVKTVTSGFLNLTFILEIDHGKYVLSLLGTENKRVLDAVNISQALSESNDLINDALS